MGSRPVQGVVLLVVVAGCAGAPFGIGSEASPDETLSPVPLDGAAESPTAGPPSSSVEAPPGVARDWSVNATRLRFGHSDYLEGRSYTWVVEYDANGSGAALRWTVTRRVEVEGESVIVEESGSPEADARTLYFADDEAYERVVTDDGPSVRRTDESRDAYTNGGEVIEQFLTGLDPTVSVVERAGETYYRLSAIGQGAPPTLREVNTRIVDYSVTAYVTPDGFVRTLVVEYSRQSNTKTQRISIRFRYGAVGSTSVSKPVWLDVSPSPTAETGTAKESSCSYVFITKNLNME
jgi:hypothetical protein